MTKQELQIYTQFLTLFDYDDMPFPEHERMRYAASRVHVYHTDEKKFSVLYELVMFSETTA